MKGATSRHTSLALSPCPHSISGGNNTTRCIVVLLSNPARDTQRCAHVFLPCVCLSICFHKWLFVWTCSYFIPRNSSIGVDLITKLALWRPGGWSEALICIAIAHATWENGMRDKRSSLPSALELPCAGRNMTDDQLWDLAIHNCVC